MSLATLLDIAFTRGCGISRSRALQSARYHELLKTSCKVTHVSAPEVAEMMYLGECLADTAFARLPYRIRQDALTWSTSTDEEQRQRLDRLFLTLPIKEWRKIRKIANTESKDDHIAEALPYERGSWARGAHNPNCLGLSQALIGYARATGAPHMMVDVVVQLDQSVEQQCFIAIQELLDLLEPESKGNASLRNLRRKLEKRRRIQLKYLAEQERIRQAHHALAIQVGKDWTVVDPYLGRLYSLGGHNQKITRWYQTLDQEPRSSMTRTDTSRIATNRPRVVRAFHECLKALHDNQQAPGIDFRDLIRDVTVSIHWFKNQTLMPVTSEQIQRTLDRTVYYSLLTHEEWRRRKYPVDTRVLLRRRAKIEARQHDRNLAIIRLMYHCYRDYMGMAYDAYHDRSTGHPLIQLLHPTYHLAVMTLNHIGGHTKRPVIDLMRYDSSQWIIHDTLKEVSLSDNARFHRISARQFRMLRSLKDPRMVMPSLWLRLDQKENCRGT